MTNFFRASTLAAFLAAAIFSASQTLHAQARSGPIRLEVDASHTARKFLHAHLQFPVRPGPLVLYYPAWLPGEHMPDAPLVNLVGLKFMAGGKTIPWRRDLLDMFALHLEIPPGVSSLDADLDFLLSAPTSGFSAGASATAFLGVLNWNQVLLYPQGYPVRELTFVASVRLPAGWKFATALPGAKQNGDTVDFPAVALNTLVDSPVLAGQYFRVLQLTPGQNPPHEMDIAADRETDLAMPAEMEAHYRRLVAEAGALFGVRHYRDYHFLISLSDDVAHFGLEHHESSDDRAAAHSLVDDTARLYFADLLPHEYVHSWNGKYRRPVDLATANYQQPMRDDLLWFYEGFTNYLGAVLTARSELWSPEQARESLARTAAMIARSPGRNWRPLQDTADAAPILYDAPFDWSNWRRGTDFYEEGTLLFLDVDATLRRLTNGQKSIDDFCRIFYAGPGGEPALKTYTFDDIVATLNGLAPYDWAGFLRMRLDTTAPPTPIEAIENGGWKLIYNEQPNAVQESADAMNQRTDLGSSIGLILTGDGVVADVIRDGPSFNAGIGPGMKITAVDGKPYSPAEIKNAVAAARSAAAPIHLTVVNGALTQTCPVAYHGGLQYPHLVRDKTRPDYLSDILRPRTP